MKMIIILYNSKMILKFELGRIISYYSKCFINIHELFKNNPKLKRDAEIVAKIWYQV
jgi:hypothetical protein